MIKEVIATGASVEEAKEKAIAELCAGIDEDVEFEVLATPKKKTLGLFGGSLAKVRVFVEVPDPKPQKAPKAEKQPAPKKREKTVEKKEPVKAEKVDTAEKAEKTQTEYSEAVAASELPADSAAKRAVDYLENILRGLGCENVNITVQTAPNAAVINLEGEGLGVVIGRRGETLDSLQYLTSLAAKSGEGYFRVTLNIGNYREKREVTLRNLAKRMANQALRTGRSRSLEPMNPYERRIIHTTVQSIEGVVSGSVGDGDRRHVVIRPVNADNNRRGRNDSRQSAKPVSSEVQRERKTEHSEVTLYGKIN